MNTRKIQMPREVYIGPDVIYETGEICMDLHLDNKVLVLTGPNTYDIAAKHAIESLEKYSLQNAVKYEYFYDKWVSVTDVLDMIPLKVEAPEEYVNKHRQVELKDTAYYYFLNVSDYRGVGEEKPYEFARSEVKDLLVNQKRVSFMEQVKNDLYQQAVSKKKIIYNY